MAMRGSDGFRGVEYASPGVFIGQRRWGFVASALTRRFEDSADSAHLDCNYLFYVVELLGPVELLRLLDSAQVFNAKRPSLAREEQKFQPSPRGKTLDCWSVVQCCSPETSPVSIF